MGQPGPALGEGDLVGAQLVDTLVADPEIAGQEDDACLLAVRVD
ncbi:hypothetical protein [Streptomyces sp. NPDC013457]